jgi:acyl carrier protein
MTPTLEQLFAKAHEIVATCVSGHQEDLEPSTDLVAKYRMDSLDILDLGLAIEQAFGVELSEEDSSRIRSLDDIVRTVQAAMQNMPEPSRVG